MKNYERQHTDYEFDPPNQSELSEKRKMRLSRDESERRRELNFGVNHWDRLSVWDYDSTSYEARNSERICDSALRKINR